MAYVDFLHGGNIYEVKRRHKRKIIDFSANINPLGLHPVVKKAINNNLDKILHYPDPKARNVTGKIAKYWGINTGNLLLGNGSAELIYLITSTIKPKTALIPIPTFSEYERAAKNAKSKIRFLKLEEKESFRFSFSSFTKADVIFLCNPNNPTGNLIMEDYKAIKKFANKLLVVDEAFMDFLPDEKKYTLIWKACQDKKIIVLRTFTKFFALPGLRIGYLVGHEDVIRALKEYQIPWNVNVSAQLAAEAILDNRTYIKKSRQLIQKEREFLFNEIVRIKGLTPYPSVTNFLLMKIGKAGMTSKSLRKSLIEQGVLVRDCANFRNLNDKYIRVAVRSHKENIELLTALKEVL